MLPVTKCTSPVCPQVFICLLYSCTNSLSPHLSSTFQKKSLLPLHNLAQFSLGTTQFKKIINKGLRLRNLFLINVGPVFLRFISIFFFIVFIFSNIFFFFPFFLCINFQPYNGIYVHSFINIKSFMYRLAGFCTRNKLIPTQILRKTQQKENNSAIKQS